MWHEVTQAAHALVGAKRAPEQAPEQHQLGEMANYIRSGPLFYVDAACHCDVDPGICPISSYLAAAC